jgi:glutamate racemase
MIGKEVLSIAVPDLAAAIEFGASPEVIRTSIETVLSPHSGQFDVLILACTHYPLVRDVFAEILPPGVIIFDPAEAVAERAKQLFWPMEVGSGTTHFIISQESEHFRTYVVTLFPGMKYTIEVLS